MKKLALLVLCLALGMGTAWASNVWHGSTDPNQFSSKSDFCYLYGCDGSTYLSPTLFVSFPGALTGLVGNTSGQDWQTLKQDSSWYGNFPSGMGVVYNGVLTLGNAPTGIGIYLDQPVNGVGAWIQAAYFGPFTASLTLLDSNLDPVFTFVTVGDSEWAPGTGLFIGAYHSSYDIWGAVFTTNDQNFGIGNLKLDTVPEPNTLLLVGPSLLGLAGVLRRRFKGVQ